MERRPACDLYHSALQVQVPEGTFVIEQTPVPDLSGKGRGVVAEGAVGSRWAGRFRIFRYEIRLWRNGHIPDVAEAVDSPRRLSNDEDRARRVLDLVAQVPTPVWGRDELATGEMWNSNSVIAWVISRSGMDTESIQPPAGGRPPGWQAGLVVARRQETGAGAPAAPHRGRQHSAGGYSVSRCLRSPRPPTWSSVPAGRSRLTASMRHPGARIRRPVHCLSAHCESRDQTHLGA